MILEKQSLPPQLSDPFLWVQTSAAVVMGEDEEAVILSWILEKGQNWASAAMQSQHFLELGTDPGELMYGPHLCATRSPKGFYIWWVSVLQTYLDFKAFALAIYSAWLSLFIQVPSFGFYQPVKWSGGGGHFWLNGPEVSIFVIMDTSL